MCACACVGWGDKCTRMGTHKTIHWIDFCCFYASHGYHFLLDQMDKTGCSSVKTFLHILGSPFTWAINRKAVLNVVTLCLPFHAYETCLFRYIQASLYFLFLHSTTKTNESLCLFVCSKTHFHLPNGGAQQLGMRFSSFREWFIFNRLLLVCF